MGLEGKFSVQIFLKFPALLQHFQGCVYRECSAFGKLMCADCLRLPLPRLAAASFVFIPRVNKEKTSCSLRIKVEYNSKIFSLHACWIFNGSECIDRTSDNDVNFVNFTKIKNLL